jgi:hypothetical protein
MTARTPTLTPGEQIANMEIRELLSGVVGKAVYRVRFGCCGTEGTIRQEAIRRRRLKGVTLCRACSSQAKLAKLAARRIKPPEPLAPGAKDLRGQWWPKLGPLGPRWGQKDTRAARAA